MLMAMNAQSYLWSPAGSLNNATIAMPTSSATVTTTYTVTMSKGYGCDVVDALLLTVNSLPTVVANATAAAICTGDAVTLTGSGATSYTWTGSVTDNVAFNPTATATYTVTGTDGNGCVNADNITVTVNALPSVAANASATAICLGDSVILTGSGATSYTWTNSVVDGVSFAPTISDVYTVTGTDANGCMNTDNTLVTVNTLPTVVANSTATAVCDGSPVTLSGSGAATYTWTGSVTDNVAFTPTSTDTYTVTGTDANGCMNTDNITVSVNVLPTVVANTTAAAVCAGSPVTLSGSGAATYTWTGIVTDNVAFNPAATDTYTVTGTDGNGCVNTASVTVTVNSLPNVTVSLPVSTVCVDDADLTLTGGSPAGGIWSGTNVSGSSFNPTAAGSANITYTFTDANGCVNNASSSITVSLCTGIAEVATVNGINIYPNPNAGQFTILLSSAPVDAAQVEVMNALGQVVDVFTMSGTTQEVNISTLDNGVYFIRVINSGTNTVQRVVKQ